MHNVLIVDDHEFMCDSLALALEGTGGFKVIGRLATASDADSFCGSLKPDLIIMDVCTDYGASGLDAVKTIREKYPEIKVIVMSGFDEFTYAPRAKEVGAHAFLSKSKSLDYFIEAAGGVIRGETYHPRPKTVPTQEGELPLTAREMDVLRLMCKNLTKREIAEELFISENTVKTHIKNMLVKTGFSKAADLAFYVISRGWINPLF